MPVKPTVVLGMSLGHGDSSAALVVDGMLVAAAEEERFNRVKHYALFPMKAIEYCLAHANIEPRDVDAIAIARKPWNGFFKKLSMVLRHPNLFQSKKHQTPDDSTTAPMGTLLKRAGLGSAKLVRVEHHLAHMLSARYLTDAETVALLTFDGLGDFVSAAIGVANGDTTKILSRVYFPHSVGFFYTAMTQYLGFPHFGDEFKVMGLSSYGTPRYLPAMRNLIREAEPFGFQLNLEAFPLLKNPLEFTIEKGQPKVKPFFQRGLLTHMLGLPPRKATEELTEAHQDLAKSIQARFEEIANHLLTQLHRRVPSDTVALAGGCAHNSVWVGKIPQTTPFQKVFVAPASSDAGIAVGAAIHAAGRSVKPQGGHWALLGPDIGWSRASDESAASGSLQEKTFIDEKTLISWMVQELAEGKVVGLFRGRMEFGPRALGSRSILADPRDAGMRERINRVVKHRETFRPFAASVLWEHQSKWFQDSFFAPSMEAVFRVNEALAPRIGAVVHVDGTCRLQSVMRETQPFYWNLIEAFRRQTGIPMLLNTSFNDSEPIVCTEADAIRCFLNSDIDHLVLESRVLSKTQSSLAKSA